MGWFCLQTAADRLLAEGGFQSFLAATSGEQAATMQPSGVNFLAAPGSGAASESGNLDQYTIS